MENIVFNYAKAKDYDISVGRIGKLECDFILRRYPMDYAYVQVAMIILGSRDTEDREYIPLEKIIWQTENCFKDCHITKTG